MADVLAPLPERARELVRASTRKARAPEARLVKACDKLQLMLKVAVYERWGTGALAEFWDNPDNFPDPAFPPVRGCSRSCSGGGGRSRGGWIR